MSLARSSPSYGTQPYPTALLDIYRSIRLNSVPLGPPDKTRTSRAPLTVVAFNRPEVRHPRIPQRFVAIARRARKFAVQDTLAQLGNIENLAQADPTPPIQLTYACGAPQLLGIFFPNLGKTPTRNTTVPYLIGHIIVQMLQRRVSKGAPNHPAKTAVGPAQRLSRAALRCTPPMRRATQGNRGCMATARRGVEAGTWHY